MGETQISQLTKIQSAKVASEVVNLGNPVIAKFYFWRNTHLEQQKDINQRRRLGTAERIIDEKLATQFSINQVALSNSPEQTRDYNCILCTDGELDEATLYFSKSSPDELKNWLDGNRPLTSRLHNNSMRRFFASLDRTAPDLMTQVRTG